MSEQSTVTFTLLTPVKIAPAKMQRRHYAIIAKCLLEQMPNDSLRYEAANNLADFLKEENSKFDKGKFLKACQVSYRLKLA